MGKKLSILPVFVYIFAALFLFYEMALQVSPSVMTHDLMRDFSINASGLGVMAAFYFYSYTIMQIPAGLMYDHLGPRYLITGAVCVCVIGAFFFGMTQTLALASLGRFLMGVGSAFAFIGVLVVAARFFKPKRFAFLVGVAQLLAALGAMGGEIPLAASVNDFGWRDTMNFLAFVGIGLAICCAFIIRNRPPKHKHPPAVKEILSVWKKLKDITLHRQTWWIGLYAFSSWAPVAIFAALWGVPFLMDNYGVSNTVAAVATGMVWLGIGLTSPVLGWLSDKLGRRRLLLRVCSLIGLIASSCVIYLPDLPFSVTCILLFFFGIASSGQILTFALIKDINRPSMTATAIGLNNMAVVAGGALFQPLVGWMLMWHWGGTITGSIPNYSVHDYRFALAIVPLSYLIGLIASSFFIKETFCRPTYESHH